MIVLILVILIFFKIYIKNVSHLFITAVLLGTMIINELYFNSNEHFTFKHSDSFIKHQNKQKCIFDNQKKGKLIFDGYPRSLSQAEKLDLLLKNSNQKIDFIFFLNVNKDTIIKRIEKRKIIEKRSDDELDTILKRYDTYMETTKPVLEFYSKKPNFHEIDGALEIDKITNKIGAFLRV